MVAALLLSAAYMLLVCSAAGLVPLRNWNTDGNVSIR
jgi:hypothetical protein